MTKQLRKYPQRDETWFLLIHCPISQGALPDTSLPYAMLLFNHSEGQALNLEISPGKPSTEKIVALLHQTIKTPSSEESSPYRPAELQVEDKALLKGLSSLTAELGIKLSYNPHSELADYFEHELFKQLVRGYLPGLLAKEETSPDLVGDFFSAAALFYRVAPWAYLSPMQPLSVHVLGQGKPHFVSLIGVKGDLPGLVYSPSWEFLKSKLIGKETSDKSTPPGGYHSCTFSDAGSLPHTDLDAVDEYDWKVAGPNAFPFPLIMTGQGALRPGRDQLLWYQAAFRALSEFVPSIDRDSAGEFLPSQATLQVDTNTGEVKVEIVFPAGELQMETLPIPREKAKPSHFKYYLSEDLRKKENSFGYPKDTVPKAPPDQARALIHQAWQESNRANRVTLAYKALDRSRQCADAYIILAEDAAKTQGKALRYYQQAVNIAEQELDAEPWAEPDLESAKYVNMVEPYLRAKEGLAHTLLVIGKWGKAVEHFQDMIHLVSSDPFDVRVRLLSLLLDLERYQEADELLAEYQDDSSAHWLYTQALRLFQRQGNSREARRALKKALKSNSLVPDYLTYKAGTEDRTFDSFTQDEEVADRYTRRFRPLWRRIPGAVNWLEKYLEK